MRFALLVLAVLLVPAAAVAEEPAAPRVTTLKTIVIVGRPDRPKVVIELTHPTAAHDASIAHDAMRSRSSR